MKNIVVAQLGARMHYAIPRILDKEHKLRLLFTDISSKKGWFNLLNLLPSKYVPSDIRKLKQRNPKGILAENIIHFPLLAFKYAIRHRKARNKNESLINYIEEAKEFNASVLKLLPQNVEGIYAFNTVALELFQHSSKGTIKILEQTIAPYFVEREIMQSEYKNYPTWTNVSSNGQMSPEELAYGNRELEELKLADHIICASTFVRDSIKSLGVDVSNCHVVPYGFSFDGIKDDYLYNKKHEKSKIQILFVGRIGLRKGVHYINMAAKNLMEEAEFTLVGPIDIPFEVLNEFSPNVNVVGAVDREKVAEYYKNADVFLMPSLCEGSATVIYEALAYSLPVITTKNSGSLIINNEDGFIIPIRNSKAIENAILKFKDKDLRMSFKAKSKEKQSQSSFEAYQDRVVNLFCNLN